MNHKWSLLIRISDTSYFNWYKCSKCNLTKMTSKRNKIGKAWFSNYITDPLKIVKQPTCGQMLLREIFE